MGCEIGEGITREILGAERDSTNGCAQLEQDYMLRKWERDLEYRERRYGEFGE